LIATLEDDYARDAESTGGIPMKRTLVNLVVAMVLCLGIHSADAADKIDVSTIITKADAEAILGVPVRDAKGSNKEGADGYYDSEWSYYAVKGDQALVLDVISAKPGITEKMFSVLGAEGSESTPVEGFGDKAIFYKSKMTLHMLNILKGNILIAIGMSGVPADTALEQEKSIAKKILAHL
jgi:hypothetical protein